MKENLFVTNMVAFSFQANTTEPKMWTYYYKTNDKSLWLQMNKNIYEQESKQNYGGRV